MQGSLEKPHRKRLTDCVGQPLPPLLWRNLHVDGHRHHRRRRPRPQAHPARARVDGPHGHPGHDGVVRPQPAVQLVRGDARVGHSAEPKEVRRALRQAQGLPEVAQRDTAADSEAVVSKADILGFGTRVSLLREEVSVGQMLKVCQN